MAVQHGLGVGEDLLLSFSPLGRLIGYRSLDHVGTSMIKQRPSKHSGLLNLALPEARLTSYYRRLWFRLSVFNIFAGCAPTARRTTSDVGGCAC